jgi:ferrochelatase
MPEYVGESADGAPQSDGGSDRDTPERLGVLLVNLGTPDASTPAAVRRFLAEFLWDPRIIEAPRWLWWLALHGVILRLRPAKSAHAYRQIWSEDGSPLLLHSLGLSKAVRGLLATGHDAAYPAALGSEPEVALGMSYGSPSIAQALGELRRAGARRLVVLPLYPQYSGTTTGSVFDRVSRELQRWRWIPELHFINGYHEHGGYIDAVSESIRNHWRVHEQTHLLFSFHGIPQRYQLAGDPYYRQCMQTARVVAARLDLDAADWSISFQSQVGREAWLRPYTDETLIQYAREGRKRITVVCPGFATDCLETLEEIDLRNRQSFLDHGGEYYQYVPALNASEAHAQLLADIVRRHAADSMRHGTAAVRR